MSAEGLGRPVIPLNIGALYWTKGGGVVRRLDEGREAIGGHRVAGRLADRAEGKPLLRCGVFGLVVPDPRGGGERLPKLAALALDRSHAGGVAGPRRLVPSPAEAGAVGTADVDQGGESSGYCWPFARLRSHIDRDSPLACALIFHASHS